MFTPWHTTHSNHCTSGLQTCAITILPPVLNILDMHPRISVTFHLRHLAPNLSPSIRHQCRTSPQTTPSHTATADHRSLFAANLLTNHTKASAEQRGFDYTLGMRYIRVNFSFLLNAFSNHHCHSMLNIWWTTVGVALGHISITDVSTTWTSGTNHTQPVLNIVDCTGRRMTSCEMRA